MLIFGFLCLVFAFNAVICAADLRYWNDVASDSSGQYLAAISYWGNNTISLSNDFGISWHLSTTLTSTDYEWTGVYSDPTGQMLIISSKPFAPHVLKAPIFISQDRGQTWTTNDEASWGYFMRYLVGDATGKSLWTRNAQLIRSNDGGKHWDEVVLLNSMDNSDCGMASDANGSNLFVCYGVYIMVSNDGGVTWKATLRVSPSDGNWVNVVTDSSGTYVFAVSQGAFYASVDFGQTWTQVMTVSMNYGWYFTDIACDAIGRHVYATASSITSLDALGDSTSLFSLDIATMKTFNLKTWKNDHLYTVATSSNGETIVVGSQQLYTSNDAGKTWTAGQFSGGLNY